MGLFSKDTGSSARVTAALAEKAAREARAAQQLAELERRNKLANRADKKARQR